MLSLPTTLAVVLAAGTVQAAPPLSTLGKAEGRVDIIAWPSFIERGETDPRLRLGHAL